MTTRTPAKLAVSLATVAACALTARAEDVSPPPAPSTEPAAVESEAHDGEGGGARVKLSTPLDASFTSNLFHVQDRRLAAFDSHRDPGQRFDGIDALWDVVLRPGARATVDLSLGRKRDVELGVGADYFLHQNNGIADYLKLQAEGTCDLTRHDQAKVEAKYVPRRFSKNHHPPDDATNFEHDYVTELEVAAKYDRKWSHAVATRIEYRFQQEANDDPFQDRDQIGHEGRASLLVGLSKGSRILVGGGLGVYTAAGGNELSGLALQPIFVDRSFREIVILGGFHLTPSPMVGFDGNVEVRTRTFTTGVEADTTYFDRLDRRLKLELGLTRKIGRSFSLEAFAGWTRNYSNRSDPNLTAEEAGYQEIVLGGAATWRFSTGRER